MRGPKHIPVGTQIARGDPRKIGKNKLKEKLASLPKAQRGFPRCPERLSGIGRLAWDELSQQLEIMNQDHRPDAIMLEGLCSNFAIACEADEALKQDGVFIREPIMNRRGDQVGEKVRTHPAAKVSGEAWMRVRAFCAEFGFSPSSLTRLRIEKPDDGAEDLASILSKPRPAVN